MDATGFIDRLTKAYGAPYGDATGEIAVLLGRQLGGFSGPVLEAVSERIILTRDRRTWPAPVEIIGACNSKQTELTPRPERRIVEDDWDEAHCEAADRLIVSELGRRAAEGGWLELLWEFCRKHKRLPEGREVDQVYRDAELHLAVRARIKALLNDGEKWDGGPAMSKEEHQRLRRSLKAFGRKMEDKAAERAAMVLERTRKSA